MFLAYIFWMGDNWLPQTIAQQKAALAERLEFFMAVLAQKCAAVWDGPALDTVLTENLMHIPFCHLLYAVNTEGHQLSANIGLDGTDLTRRGQDLSGRPYITAAVPYKGFLLSQVYVSQIGGRPCVSAIQVVTKNQVVLGFVVADFDLRDLPLLEIEVSGKAGWRQIKGDPAIRETLFMQQRVNSAMDKRIDDVISIMDELICERGIFHGKLHFSGSRATLWLTDDPYRYRLHVLEEITSPDVCLAYPSRAYPQRAVVPREQVRQVFERFKVLRQTDETIYLRSGSLNVINGMVGLTFSCDGSHYMPAGDFLAKETAFWFGT